MIFLSLAALFAFPGGSDADLGRSVRSALELPVVCSMRDTKEVVQQFKIDWKDRDYLVRRIGAEAGRTPEAKDGTAWSSGAWPAQHLLPESFAEPGKLPKSGRYGEPELISCSEPESFDKEFKNSSITMSMGKDQGFQLSRLESLKFGKKVTVHWFYKDLWVSLNTSNATKLEVLKAIATAAGAKLHLGKDHYELDFDPEAFRKRALKTYMNRQSAGLTDDLAESYRFGYAVLKQLPAKTLAKIYSNPKAAVEVRLPATATLLSIIARRVEVGPEGRREFFRTQVDMDGPFGAEIRPRGRILCVVSLKNGSTLSF